MIKRMVIMLVAVALVLGGIFGFQAFKASMIKKFMSQMSAPPQTVSTAKAAYDQWQSTIQAVGSLRAVKGADLSLEAAGTIDSITFNSGDDVEAGTVLLKLRADDDVAKLASLQATAALNHITYDRDLKQAKIQAVSQATAGHRRRQREKRRGPGGGATGRRSTRRPCARRLRVISASAPSTSGNTWRPAPWWSLCRRSIRSISISSCRSRRSIRCSCTSPWA